MSLMFSTSGISLEEFNSSPCIYKRGKRKIAEEVLRALQYSRSTLTATTTPQVVSESRPSHSPPNTDYPAGIGLVTPSTAPRIPAIICSPNLDTCRPDFYPVWAKKNVPPLPQFGQMLVYGTLAENAV
ncbi:hypothetical protein J6590_017415 [Homalodisca vitripennis]|nr:hypothetical protein J6590_017415 [Homalodisca vitripennis]